VELLVATWTIRLTFVAVLVTGFITLSSGLGMLDVVLRASLVAFVLLYAGRQALNWLETPEQKLARLRAKRTKKRAEA
jgi:hydrogenase/urease accessory protein HupE